jgi:hypothetical protein
MPANAKYLTASLWQRFAKISAGILGGYFVSVSLHQAIAAWVNHINVIITSSFSGFILWAVLMILTFLDRNGWRVWLIYVLLTALFSLIAYSGKLFNPNFLHHG